VAVWTVLLRTWESGRRETHTRKVFWSDSKVRKLHHLPPHPKLHPHAYTANPNLRATASEAPFSHDVL